jgi:alkylmercury lyase-like protein
MDERDRGIRNRTYELFVDRGRAPTVDEAAAFEGVSREELVASWRRLDEAHALVLDPTTDEIRMANPFSAVPTPYRVRAAGRSWYANCAWDAFGICAALGSDGHIDTACPDCGDAISLDVRGGQPDADRLVFHCLVPAARWWDDIVYT